MPPLRAIAIAMRLSVTVSMAAESSGDCTRMRRVSREDGVGLARDHVGVPGQQHHVVVGEADEAEGVGLVHDANLNARVVGLRYFRSSGRIVRVHPCHH